MIAGDRTDGAITAYIRYNPQYSNPTSGYFISRSSVEAEFETEDHSANPQFLTGTHPARKYLYLLPDSYYVQFHRPDLQEMHSRFSKMLFRLLP